MPGAGIEVLFEVFGCLLVQQRKCLMLDFFLALQKAAFETTFSETTEPESILKNLLSSG